MVLGSRVQPQARIAVRQIGGKVWFPASPCSLIVPHLLRADAPDPAAEQGPVNGKSTEGGDDEDSQ
jgi:hypothetical protein